MPASGDLHVVARYLHMSIWPSITVAALNQRERDRECVSTVGQIKGVIVPTNFCQPALDARTEGPNMLLDKGAFDTLCPHRSRLLPPLLRADT